jgi:transposase
LFEIGVDEVSWRKRHNYLTLVSNHHKKKVVWGAEACDTATLDGFFDELGAERSERSRRDVDHGGAVRRDQRHQRGVLDTGAVDDHVDSCQRRAE